MSRTIARKIEHLKRLLRARQAPPELPADATVFTGRVLYVEPNHVTVMVDLPAGHSVRDGDTLMIAIYPRGTTAGLWVCE